MFPKIPRSQTRRQRYENKIANGAKEIPLGVCLVNFSFNANIAMTIRTAVCYGAEIMVIGSIPSRADLRAASGSTVDFAKIRSFSNPMSLLEASKEEGFNLVSAEITPYAHSLNEYNFDLEKKNVIVIGNESVGVPEGILLNSDVVYIPHRGGGFCLNASVAASIMINEFNRQYFASF